MPDRVSIAAVFGDGDPNLDYDEQRWKLVRITPHPTHDLCISLR